MRRLLLLLGLLALPASGADFYMLTLVRSLIADSEHFFLVQLGGEESGLVHIFTTCATTGQTHRSQAHFVPEGFASLPYRIPFRNYSAPTLRLEFRIFLCARRSRRACSLRPGRQIGRERTSVPVLRRSVFLYADLSKPVFKPRDDVRFRLLALYPAHLHPERFGFRESATEGLRIDRVSLLAPSGRLVAQWRNVSWLDALRGFSYTLPADAAQGRWRVSAQLGQTAEERAFSVRRFVLPRFTVSLKPPPFLRADSRNVTFHVCARHGTGRPIKAQVSAQLCLQPQLCVKASARLDGSNLCAEFVESTAPFKLRDCDLRLGEHRLTLNATVTEDGSGVSLRRSRPGGPLTFYPFRIVVDSPDMFKPGLPYYGRARTLNPNGSPVAAARLRISFEGSDGHDAFQEVFTADQQGVVRFQIPALFHNASSVNLQFQWADYQRHAGCEALRQPETFFVLRRLYSGTETFLQAVPLSVQKMEAACKAGYLSLRLQATVPLHDKTISIVGTARGILMSGQSFGPRRKQLCRDTDDIALGHYQCMGEKNGMTKIKCLPGWRGRNCLTPICSHGCARGVCRSRDRCVCQRHWTGVACHRCRRSPRCVHGVCRRGGDCVCQPGWSGYNCDRRVPSTASRALTDTVLPVVRPDLSESRPETSLSLFERDLELRVTPQLSPASRLAVWFLFKSSGGREFVATSVALDSLSSCMQRSAPTRLSFSRPEVRPGELVSARLSTSGRDPHCALSLSDATLDQFEAGPGLADQLDDALRSLGDLLAAGEPSAAADRRRCGAAGASEVQDPRPPDSSAAFRLSGLLVLSSARVVTAPCPPPRFLPPDEFFGPASGGRLRLQRLKEKGVGGGAAGSGTLSSAGGLSKAVTTAARRVLRRFFPESWRFVLLSSPGENLTLWAPDSITTWQSRLYCVSSRGLGISPPARLVVSQPFFLQMSLPYSLVRGETARVPVQVFSYVHRCAQVDISVGETSLRVLGQRSFSACLCNFNQVTVHFTLTSNTLGWMSVEVKAVLSHSPRCAGVMAVSGSSTPKKIRAPLYDAVRRRVLVEPEGVPESVSDGDLLCVRNGSRERRVRISVPSAVNLVSGSERAYLTWSSDVVAASLSRLHRLIRLPYGCGEQNMMAMVPSIYVSDYLRASNDSQAKTETLARAKKFMEVGYQRQLRYRHNDGSFSAFGRFDTRGSTWLTAFVIKSFAAASRHIEIDMKVVHSALSFLRGKTRPDSCFREDGRVLTPGLKGGLGADKDEVSISAYVLGALLDTKLVLPEVSPLHRDLDLGVRKGLACLRRHTPDNLSSLSTYTLALRAHALTRIPNIAAEPHLSRILAELTSRRIRTRAGAYWPAGPRASRAGAREWVRYTAEDVETTGYALLTEMRSLRVGGLQAGVRWLVAQRNDQGGWFSTQDTIVALQALTEFAKMKNMAQIANLTLTLRRADEEGPGEMFRVDEESRLVSTKVRVSVPAELRVRVAGSGCVALQQHVLFHVSEVGRQGSPFRVSVTANQRPDQCSRATLTACASYVGANASNMAIMRVGMASGWEVAPDEFQALRTFMKEGGLRRAEVAKDKALLLYFDRLTSKRACVRMTLTRTMEVAKLRPMIVQVYDYYRPDVVEETSVSVLSRKCLPRRRRVVGNACPRCANADLSSLCRNDSLWLAAVSSGPGRAWSFARHLNGSGLFWSGELTFSASCRCSPQPGGLLTRSGSFDVAESLVLDPSWTLLPLRALLNASGRPPLPKCLRERPGLKFALAAGREMLSEAAEAARERQRSAMTLERPETACPVCARHIGPAIDSQLREAVANHSLDAFLVVERPDGRQWFLRGSGRLLRSAEKRRVIPMSPCRRLACSYERRPDGSRLFMLVTRNRNKVRRNPLRPDGDFVIGAPRSVLRLGFARGEATSPCARCLADVDRSWVEAARIAYLLHAREAVLLAADASPGGAWTFRDVAGGLLANRCASTPRKCPEVRCGVTQGRRMAVVVLMSRAEFDAALWRGACLQIDGRFVIGELPR